MTLSGTLLLCGMAAIIGLALMLAVAFYMVLK